MVSCYIYTFIIHLRGLLLIYVAGQLQVGDQLLEVNGINLIGVSREE